MFPDTSADETMVAVARFRDPLEAQMAQSLLDSEGIDSFLVGENANSLMPMALRSRLEVRRSDEIAARELLSQADAPFTDEEMQ